MEIVAQRILWSLVLILLILTARRGLRPVMVAMRDRRIVLPLMGTAIMIAINWLTYVGAVAQGHVVAASLGYFLNPLVNVMLGVLVLKERLRAPQVAAIAVAAAGVAILAASALTTLGISLLLAFSFAFYGLWRKMTPVAPMTGLGIETALLMPPALAFMLWQAGHGTMSFGQDGMTTMLLILAGAVTTVPLLLFAVAAHRLPMATLGLMQYLAPTLQFLCGVFLLGEKLTGGQVASFALIWVGLILFAGDGIVTARKRRMATV